MKKKMCMCVCSFVEQINIIDNKNKYASKYYNHAIKKKQQFG